MRFFLTVYTLFFPLMLLYGYEYELTDVKTKGKLESARFDEIVEKYLATVSMYDPERATLLGIHDNDALITQRDYATQTRFLETLKFLKKDIERIDYEVMDQFKKSEYDALYSMLEKDIYEMENLNRLALYPQDYLKTFDTVYFMMTKDYAVYISRAKSAFKRLSQIPEILYQAERNLTRPPKEWTLYSIKKASSVLENIGDYYNVFRNYIGLDPTVKTEFDKTISELKNSLERYIKFLKVDVLRKSDGKPFTGLYTYGFYLEKWHRINYNPMKAMRFAKKRFKNNYEKLKDIAKTIAPDKYKEGGIGTVYSSIGGDIPAYDDVVNTISSLIEKVKNHFDEYRVIRYPSQRLTIQLIPGFMYDYYPSVFYLPPFPLDRERVGEIYIYYPQAVSQDVQKQILFSIYSQPKMELFISMLIMPGLHARYDYLYDVPKIRKISYQPSLDGWMDYSLDLAKEMGYFSSVHAPFLIQYLKALRALRAYIDVAFHIEEMSWDECIDLFKKYFQFSQTLAEREMINISMNPTYSFAVLYGYENISKLRDKYVSMENRFFDLRDFNSDFLSRGNIPLNNIEDELKFIRKERIRKKIMEEENE